MGYPPPVWKRAQVHGLKESRLTIREDEDQDRVASEDVLTSSLNSPHHIVSRNVLGKICTRLLKGQVQYLSSYRWSLDRDLKIFRMEI